MVAKKFVVVALPAVREDEYRFVEVELVVVLFTPVKFCKVEEASSRRFVTLAVPFTSNVN